VGKWLQTGEGTIMWVLTKSDWPVLVNLTRAATVGYQQIMKFDPRTRVIASAWEQEHVLADCADGEEAKAIVAAIARALAEGTPMLDLRGIDLAASPLGAEVGRT
jgi:hypothetical protein